jgi:transposase InsO family protein
MSRSGNCHDNAVAESFLQRLKPERIRRQVYPSRNGARAHVFNHVEMFYNRRRRHGTAGALRRSGVNDAIPNGSWVSRRSGRFTSTSRRGR